MKEFRDYVTSAAFRLDLSQGMIKHLLLVEIGRCVVNPKWPLTEPALTRRGLVKRVITNESRGYSETVLTEAGKLVVELVKLAGFSLDQKTIDMVDNFRDM